MIEYRGWILPEKESHFFPWIEDYPNTIYQQESINEALRYIKSFKCAVDVGANVGLHTVRFDKMFDSVVSFEPASLNFSCLQKNIEKCRNVEIHNIGLGESIETLEIKLPADSQNYGLFSLVDYENYQNDVIKEQVSISTLDSFSLAPDLIKIDTQGFEIPVLMGAKNTLINYKPVLIIEIENKKEIEKYKNIMSTFGYYNFTRISKDYIWWIEK